MQQSTARLNPISQLAAALLLVVFNLTAAVAATPAPPAGTQIYPAVSNTQAIELVGGSTENVTWTAPAAGTYKLWAQIPANSNAVRATYTLYPKGNAVGNTACSSTDPTYPCYQVVVDQSITANSWVQLMLNNQAATSWTFTPSGYVSINASNISNTHQLGIAKLVYQSTVTPPPVFSIGQSYQGGKIFYIDSSKQHGLIAAPTDQSAVMRWWNGSFSTTGATGTAIGTGQANTTAIVKAQGAGSYAAKLCDDLVLGGYSDWYLPSKDELNQLYLNQAVVGGFASNNYWSSSEYDYSYAWGQSFGGGYQGNGNKNYALAVRAVRAF